MPLYPTIRRYRVDVCSADHDSEWHRRSAIRIFLREEEASLAEALVRSGVPGTFIKGFSTERAYGRGYVRSITDLDLAVRSLADFWKAADIFSKMGYRISTFALRNHQRSGISEGVASLLKHDTLIDDWSAELEVQIAAQPTGWTTSVPFDPKLWAEESGRSGNWGPMYETPDSAVVTLIAQIADRPQPVSRDYTDLVMLLRQLSASELQAVISRAGSHFLLGYFANAIDRIKRSGSLLELWGPANRDFFLERHGRAPASYRLYRAQVRAAERGFFGALSASTASAVAHVLTSGGSRRKATALAFISPKQAQGLCRSGVYLHFLPLDTDSSEDMQWIIEGEGLILATPVGRFLAAPFGIASKQVMQRMKQS